MAEGVGKDGMAAGVDQLADGIGAGGVLADVGLHHHLGVIVQAKGLAGGLHALDVVLVVGVGGFTHQDEANLQVSSGDAGGLSGLAAGLFRLARGAAAGGQAHSQHAGHEQSKNTLFHFGSSCFFVFAACRGFITADAGMNLHFPNGGKRANGPCPYSQN